MCPPRIRFLTRIYHPNIDRLGRICLDVLKNNWSPALQIRTILLSIQALLGAPNPEDPLNEAVAKQWKVSLMHFLCQLDWACSSISNTGTGEPAGGHQNRTRVDTAIRSEEMNTEGVNTAHKSHSQEPINPITGHHHHFLRHFLRLGDSSAMSITATF
jgi:hypothetical protein